MLTCTRCENTGFLNISQVDDNILNKFDSTGNVNTILGWINTNDDHDVQICDCCGDGNGWYGEPGYHYSENDLPGYNGPYCYNGGLCECH